MRKARSKLPVQNYGVFPFVLVEDWAAVSSISFPPASTRPIKLVFPKVCLVTPEFVTEVLLEDIVQGHIDRAIVVHAIGADDRLTVLGR